MAKCPGEGVIKKKRLRPVKEEHKKGRRVDEKLFDMFEGTDKIDDFGRTPKERVKTNAFKAGLAAANVAAKVFKYMDYPFAQLERTVLRPLNLFATQKMYAPTVERFQYVASKMYHVLGDKRRAAIATWIAERARFVSSMPMNDPDVVSAFRKMVSDRRGSIHIGSDIEEMLRELEKPVIPEFRNQLRDLELSESQITMAMLLAYQYSNPTAIRVGSKYESRVPIEMRQAWEGAKRAVLNPEKFPEFWKYEPIIKQLFEHQLRTKIASDWYTDEVAKEILDRDPTLNYIPEHDIVRLANIENQSEAFRDFDNMPSSDPSMFGKHYREGLMQRAASDRVDLDDVSHMQTGEGGRTNIWGPHLLRNMDLPIIAAQAEARIGMVNASNRFKTYLTDSTVEDYGTKQRVNTAVWSDSPLWEAIVDTGGQKFYREIDSPGYKNERNGARMMVARDVAELLESFAGGKDKGVGGLMMRWNGRMKKVKLSLSAFHHHALMMNAAVYGVNPFKLMRGDDHRALMRDPGVLEAIERFTLTLDAPDIGVNEKEIQSIFKENDGLLSKTLGRAERSIDKQLWGILYRATKAATYLELQKRLKDTGMSHDEAGMEAAKTVNKMSGGINWEWHGIKKRARNLASLILLAPDWQISNWGYALGATFSPSTSAAVTRSALMKYAIGSYVYGTIANKLATGHWMHENDPGERDKIAVKLGDQVVYIDPYRHLMEQVRVMMGLVNSILPEEMEMAEAVNPAFYAPAKISALGRLVTEATTGRNYWTGRSNATIYDVFGLQHETYNPRGIRRSLGEWGGSSRGRIDSSLILYLKTLLPISVEKFLETAVDEDDSVFGNAEPIIAALGFEGHEHHKSVWKRKGSVSAND